MKTNAKIFFIEGCELDPKVHEDSGRVTIASDAEEDMRAVLHYQLKRKEMMRWHTDKINLWTGQDGIVDGCIGKREEVVAVRSAIQKLIENSER